MENERHFVLVHGASHGARCWYKLVPLLKLAGHHVTALDLGASGVDPKQYFKRLSMESLLDCQYKFDRGQENLPTSVSFGPKYLETITYKNCLPEDIELARVLIRPCKFFLEDLAKESLLSKAKFGSVDRVFVVCEEDGVMEDEIQQWIIENSSTKEVKFIGGAAHMVMLSKPKDICLCLKEIAEKYL